MSERESTVDREARPRRGEPFFATAGVLLAGLVIAGFGLNFLFRGQALPAITVVNVGHGLVMLAWYVLFVLQARLVGRGDLRLHRRLGRSSAWLAAAMLLSGVAVMTTAYRRNMVAGFTDQAVLVATVNCTNLLTFAVLYGLGYLRRSRPVAHKRYMLLAGVAMLPPALGRLVAALGLPDAVAVLLIVGTVASLAVHDRRSAGRVESASWVGITIVLVGVFGGFALAVSGATAGLLRVLLGP